jgi:hypothetical protein
MPGISGPGRCSLTLGGDVTMDSIPTTTDGKLTALLRIVMHGVDTSNLREARGCEVDLTKTDVVVVAGGANVPATCAETDALSVAVAPSNGITLAFSAGHLCNLFHEMYAPSGLFHQFMTYDIISHAIAGDGIAPPPPLLGIWYAHQNLCAQRELLHDVQAVMFAQSRRLLKRNVPGASPPSRQQLVVRASDRSTVLVGLFKHELHGPNHKWYEFLRSSRPAPVPWVCSAFGRFTSVMRERVVRQVAAKTAASNSSATGLLLDVNEPVYAHRPQMWVPEERRLRGFTKGALQSIQAALTLSVSAATVDARPRGPTAVPEGMTILEQLLFFSKRRNVVFPEGAASAWMAVAPVGATWLMYAGHKHRWHQFSYRAFHEPLGECHSGARLIVADDPLPDAFFPPTNDQTATTIVVPFLAFALGEEVASARLGRTITVRGNAILSNASWR